MREWKNINKGSILNDRVLLLEFSNDYEKTFNQKLNVGCKLCINDAYKRLISKTNTNMKSKTNECEYKLKGIYNGSIYKSNPLRRDEMTDDLAQDLIKNHKLGIKLFESIPEIIKEDSEMTLTQLRKKHPSILSNSKSKFLDKLNDSEVVVEDIDEEE
jgi:hypothetical protein